MSESKSEQFLFRLEIDSEELQEILHKMQEALSAIRECTYELERLGFVKVAEKKTAIDK